MPAGTVGVGRRVLRRRVVAPVMVISLVGAAGQLSLAAPVPQVPLASSGGATSVSAGDLRSCAIESGKAYCWGDKGFPSQLGDGAAAGTDIPVAVDASGVLAGKMLTQISVGSLPACALDSAGAAFCWGGIVGDGSASASSAVPVAVDTHGALAGKTLIQVSAGGSDACVLDSSGAAYCWGNTLFGELGNNITGDTTVPLPVYTGGALAGKKLIQISAGSEETCALDSSGAAYCWGRNTSGQLGDGSTSDSSLPVAVDTSGVLAGKTLTGISTDGGVACALDTHGAAYCWGSNGDGELGDGTASNFAYSTVPVAVDASGVLAGKTLTQINANDGTVCATDSTGAAYCWGFNNAGQLGDDSTASSDVPVAVDASGVLAGKALTQVSPGASSTCGRDSAGAIYCWGNNRDGELGNGTPRDQATAPVLTGPQAPAYPDAVRTPGTATVYWTAPARLDDGTLTGYTATALPGGAHCTIAGARTCTLTGLDAGTVYRITIVAHTTAGDSGASPPAIFTSEPTGPIVAGDLATKCIDDTGLSAANDTPVVMWDCNSGPEQSWTTEPDGTILTNGKCLDIYRDEKVNKAPVELSTCTGGASQQWQPVNGTLVNPVSGKCLDDPRFNTTDGIQLELYTCNGGTNQQWELP
jgi:alpha-tubulin suppressor-like RCC1 family protein